MALTGEIAIVSSVRKREENVEIYEAKHQKTHVNGSREIITVLSDDGIFRLTNYKCAMIWGGDETWKRVEGRRDFPSPILQCPDPRGLGTGVIVT